ncbi:MAG: hypothetical protein OER92_07280 [Alphaproteobacteria bacterium]|nr:hypothetical protein [Alphaproteobacteria bacterium]
MRALYGRRQSNRLQTVGIFAVLGGASGTIAILIARFVPLPEISVFSWLDLSGLTVLPGLMFGSTIGVALYRRDLIRLWGGAVYAAASTLSYLSAFTLIRHVLADALNSLELTGAMAGLFGSALLTGATALLFSFARQRRPAILMLGSGCLLGALLRIMFTGDSVIYAILFFALWQAGYAASLATALPLGGRDS